MITKEKILEKVGGEEYLIRHLVPTFDINVRKKNYKSIFSEKDDRPSMSIYQEKGTWKFKSFNTGHQGDAFKLWADYYSLDCKTQFKDLLELINQEMSLGLSTEKKIKKYPNPIVSNSVSSTASQSSLPSQTLCIEYIPYSSSSIFKLYLKYWSQYHIDKSILDKFNVKQVGYLSYTSNSGRHLSFKYAESHKIVSSYDISGRVKIYIPEISSSFFNDPSFTGQKKSFSYKNQTKDDVFGLIQLSEGQLPYVLFTAGEKDCMSAYAHGFKHVVSLQSEHHIPSNDLLKQLRSKTSVLISCYDNDEAGIKASKKLEESFGIVSIQLPKEIKDIAEYFQQNSSNDFCLLLDDAISRSKDHEIISSTSPPIKHYGSSLRSRIKAHLSERFSFRFNVLTQQSEILVNAKRWKRVNTSELRDHLDMHGLICSLELIKCILRSLFVKPFNPIEEYFLAFEDRTIDDKEDYIQKIAGYVQLKDPSPSNFQVWYTHLKKWMIRAIRTVFEEDGINKHALILCSPKENIGKSFFCKFLCPPSLSKYYNSNPTMSNEKDGQKSLIRYFIINLNELHHLRFDASIIKNWLSQSEVNIRLPYQEDEITAPRISSFVGSTNNTDFLRTELGYSRWVPFEIEGTKRIDSSARALVELAWSQAYFLYKSDADSGELSNEELSELSDRSKDFTDNSTESELIEQYLSPSNREVGKFMTTTDILRYLQGLVGTTIRLNTKLVGRALKKIGFEKIGKKVNSKVVYGYWVINH